MNRIGNTLVIRKKRLVAAARHEVDRLANIFEQRICTDRARRRLYRVLRGQAHVGSALEGSVHRPEVETGEVNSVVSEPVDLADPLLERDA